MLDRVLAVLPDIGPSEAAIVGAALIAWVATVYLLTGLGLRSGELVWAGRHMRRLPTEQRWWSVLYAVGLIGSGYVLLEITDAVALGLIPPAWSRSAGFVASCLLVAGTVTALVRGSRWERMLFSPITALGAGLALWLTFG